MAKTAKQPAYARCRTDNLSEETTRLLVHRRGLPRCRDTAQDTHGELSLLVWELLLVNKVLVLQIEHLLVKGLLLTTSAKAKEQWRLEQAFAGFEAQLPKLLQAIPPAAL